MNTTYRLLVTAAFGGFVAVAASAAATDLTPAIVTNLSGSLHIVQVVPCDDNIDQTTPVTGGRIELTPAEGVPDGDGRRFTLTRIQISFAPFTIDKWCHGIHETRDYQKFSVQLANAVSFTAIPSSPGVYPISIPKSLVSVYEAAIVDDSPEAGYVHPTQDVTGSIDLNAGTFSMHLVAHQTMHFEEGCVLGSCIVNEDDAGTLTTDVSGTIVFPDVDGDGVPDRGDNCRFVANPDQTPVPTPTIVPPPPITVHSCLDHGIGIARGVDVCDGGPVTKTNNAPAQFAVGPNTVTWTVRDTKSRTATADQLVTVIDTTKPTFTFVPTDLHVFDCGPVNLGQATATDDCAGTPVVTNNSPGYFYVGDTVVTWRATDASGNVSTATQTVTVTDLVPPTVACTPTSPVGSGFIVTGFDACGAPALTLGSYAIANGEQIKIQETGQPGVRLQNTVGNDGVRKFLVGKNEGVILATDGSGNTSTAACRYPR
jgi:hypothetical protein